MGDAVSHYGKRLSCREVLEIATIVKCIEQAFQPVRKNGGLCAFASHPPSGKKRSLDPIDLISGKRICGTWGGESQPDEDIPRFVELYRQAKLPLEKLVTLRYGLDQIDESLDDLKRGRAGRPLVQMVTGSANAAVH